jgi:ribosomal protein S18 acetylase RimI-like enzyme
LSLGAWRRATPDDIEALVALIQSAYRGDASKAGWTTEAHLLSGQRIDAGMLADQIADEAQLLLLREDDAGPLACVSVERRDGYGYIGTVTVRPVMQGGGLGRQALDAAEAHIKNKWGLGLARMTVIAQRSELIAWYERRGYHNRGETSPFPYDNDRFGQPIRGDLYFVVLEKAL